LRKKYILLDSVTPLSRQDFVTALRKQISGSPGKDVFVFVHGFNQTFEDAARRTAQLAYDLDFDGTPMMYSWPSQGHLYSYFTDQEVIEPTGPRLAEFLDIVTSASGAERVHLVAHSMGNRVMIAALEIYLKAHPRKADRAAFGQLVFTAPDVDRKDFVAAFASLRGIAERTTLYASDSDLALRASKTVHGEPRAGSAGEGIIRLPGLDTIDMSGLPADALGHSYYAASGGAVYDLLHLLWRNDPPGSPQRCNTSAGKAVDPVPLWRFNVDKCKGSDLLEAGVLMIEGCVLHRADRRADPRRRPRGRRCGRARPDPGVRHGALHRGGRTFLLSTGRAVDRSRRCTRQVSAADRPGCRQTGGTVHQSRDRRIGRSGQGHG
jgi:pimeloyl-ACP methyl ester carboxylesterase